MKYRTFLLAGAVLQASVAMAMGTGTTADSTADITGSHALFAESGMEMESSVSAAVIEAAALHSPALSVAALSTEIADVKAQLRVLRAERLDLLRAQRRIRAELEQLEQQRLALQERWQESLQAAEQARIEATLRAQSSQSRSLQSRSLQSQFSTPGRDTASSSVAAITPAITHQPASVQGNSIKDQSIKGNSIPSIWWLCGLLPLGAVAAWLGLRRGKTTAAAAVHSADTAETDELYDMVFGARRDRDQQDSPAQLEQAISHIKAKTRIHDLDEDYMAHEPQEVMDILQAVAVADSAADPADKPADDIHQMVELYLMYHQFQRALGAIQAELARHPERRDLHKYLLEIHARSGDRDAFDQHVTLLREQGECDLVMAAEKYRQQYLPAVAVVAEAEDDAEPVRKAG